MSTSPATSPAPPAPSMAGLAFFGDDTVTNSTRRLGTFYTCGERFTLHMALAPEGRGTAAWYWEIRSAADEPIRGGQFSEDAPVASAHARVRDFIELKEAHAQMVEATQRVREARATMAETRARSLASSALSSTATVVSKYHACPSSPIGVCVYEDEDYLRDCCVVCDEPESRK